MTLEALLLHAATCDEAEAWRAWLLRAVAGRPGRTCRSCTAWRASGGCPRCELDWLPGYEGSRPVRVGNAAAKQLQLDVYGEVIDALHLAAANELERRDAWALQRPLIGFLEDAWNEPDEGLWEVRGPRRHFTHSKVMAWVAVDRASG